MPTAHTIDAEGLRVIYEGGIAFHIRHPMEDAFGRLWAQVIATVGGDVVNQARIDLLDQRQRIDFHAVAHGRDGRVDWQALLVPVIPLVQETLARQDTDDSTDQAPGETTIDTWPTLSHKALHGLAGILVMAIDPYTEADPVATLLNILTAFGNLVGSEAHFRVEHTRHPLRLFVALVGTTAKGRKGTSWSTPRHLLAAIDAAWVQDRVTSGLSSGEGLIYAVRDERWEKQPIRQKGRVVDYQRVMVDEGVSDKRLMLVEEEMVQALKVMSREGNILSPVIRQAWDTGNLHPLTKTTPIRATKAHISLIGHITSTELLRYLNDVEMANGYANRFLWTLVRRSKKIANPTGIPASELNPLIIQVERAFEAAKHIGEMQRDLSAESWWTQIYDDLSEGKPGLFGAITARAEVQVMRLAAIYAVLDGTSLIQVSHLEAALAVWHYCEASVRAIFGNSTGDAVADRILAALQEHGPMDRTAIRDLLWRNIPADRIDRALALLQKRRLIMRESTKKSGRGRPQTVFRLAENF